MLRAMVLRPDELEVPPDGTISMAALNEEARRSEVDFDLVLVIDSGTIRILKNRVGPVGTARELEALTNTFLRS